MSYNNVNEFLLYSFTNGAYNDVSASVIQDQLDIAANEIDAALRPHHTLPLISGSVPPVIKEAERVIAGYRLWLFMGIDPGTSGERLKERYFEVYGNSDDPTSGLLGQLAYGKRTLVAKDTTDPTPERGGPIVLGTCPRGWMAHSRTRNKDYLP